MYDLLTTSELTALQSMLFEGTEEAYKLACARDEKRAWANQYRPVHRELGRLFIEAGTELLLRFDQQVTAA
jgi:hypothetical protein